MAERRYVKEYFVPLAGDATCEMSSGAPIRDVRATPDHSGVLFYAEVHDGRPTVWRSFKLFQTGPYYPLPHNATYVGSAYLRGSAYRSQGTWHLYEVVPNRRDMELITPDCVCGAYQQTTGVHMGHCPKAVTVPE